MSGSAVDAVTGIDKRRRLLIAVVIGIGCCLIGPIFLWLYWAVHGIDGGIIQTAAFFGLLYVAPGLLAVAIGVLVGFVLSPICPRLHDFKRRTVVIGVALVANAVGIGSLLSGLLNVGVDKER